MRLNAYLIREVPTDIHARLLSEVEARDNVSSIPNLIRLIVSEALKVDWPQLTRGNQGANKGRKINQPKGKRRIKQRKREMTNTKNPTKVSDYEALIEEITSSDQSNKIKVQRLQKVWRDMGAAVWSDTHKELAKEVRAKAYDAAQALGGF